MSVLSFAKMHGLGNDFVVFDGISQELYLTGEQVRRIADRHFGIGCDQVLVVERPTVRGADFRYRIYNADGGEVEQCGNGARCFARFVRDQGLTDKARIAVQTAAGLIELSIGADGLITVNMGSPRFAPEDIPLDAEREAPSYPVDIEGEVVSLGAVSMGNPHAVLRVPDVHSAPVARLGRAIELHSRFPHRINVGFMEVSDPQHIRLRVHERGAGETLACGSGACAAVAVGRRRGWLSERVAVELPGGTLSILWQGGDAPVWMTGPAVHVFDGYIRLPLELEPPATALMCEAHRDG
jgi:diaminopimelate epimerase